MENLTKHQIVLLTLLVSFITSIATGIVTVALMNQAPTGVVQTINRVVERTIERVVATSTPSNNQIVKETVVVNADDQVVNAIEKNAKSIVRIYRTNSDPAAESGSMIIVSVGTVVSDDGIIVTDNSVISDGGKYFLLDEGGKLHDLSIAYALPGEQVALLKIKPEDKNILNLPKAVLGKQNLKLGQSVVYLGGSTKNNVATGIVSSFGVKEVKIENTPNASSTPQTQTVITSIQTTIAENNFTAGGLLLNLSGELVGIKSTYLDSARTDLFVPTDAIKAALSAYAESQKKN